MRKVKHLKWRRELTPQMLSYDRNGVQNSPYGIFVNRTNVRNKVLNTDCMGFRLSRWRDGYLSLANARSEARPNILVGGSTAFGVGATCDDATLASALARLTNEPWLSLAVRAANSLQEQIYLLRYVLGSIEPNRIVCFTGINDVVLAREIGDVGGADPFFGMQAYESMMKREEKRRRTWKRRAFEFGMEGARRLSGGGEGGGDANREGSEEAVRRGAIRYRSFLMAMQTWLNCEVVYVAQPAFSWCRKVASDNEQRLFHELESAAAAKGFWGGVANWLASDDSLRIKGWIEDEIGKGDFSYHDSNPWLKGNEDDLFVDRVHMNDAGYRLMAERVAQEL